MVCTCVWLVVIPHFCFIHCQSHMEPFDFECVARASGHFMLRDHGQIMSCLEATPRLESYHPCSLTWTQHTISLVRPVLPGDILLYRAVGLHPGECPGLVEQICVLRVVHHNSGPLFGEPSASKFPLGQRDSGSSWLSSPSPSGDKSTHLLSSSSRNSYSSPILSSLQGGHPDSDTHLPKRKSHLSPGPSSDGPILKRPKRVCVTKYQLPCAF